MSDFSIVLQKPTIVHGVCTDKFSQRKTAMKWLMYGHQCNVYLEGELMSYMQASKKGLTNCLKCIDLTTGPWKCS